jgi:UDP-N-acetylmuramate-alanine ligase
VDYLSLHNESSVTVLDSAEPKLNTLSIEGKYNRLDAWLVISAAQKITGENTEDLIAILNHFPGLQRRMEEILPNLYSDYATRQKRYEVA